MIATRPEELRKRKWSIRADVRRVWAITPEICLWFLDLFRLSLTHTYIPITYHKGMNAAAHVQLCNVFITSTHSYSLFFESHAVPYHIGLVFVLFWFDFFFFPLGPSRKPKATLPLENSGWQKRKKPFFKNLRDLLCDVIIAGYKLYPFLPQIL